MPKGYYPRRVKRHTICQPLDQSYRLIPLTQGENAIVDAEDFEWLSQWNWYANWSPGTKSFYACRSPGSRKYGTVEFIKMHRVIMKCGEGEEVDHRNHNTLDNRKPNLRKCTPKQNAFNRRCHRESYSGFKGVTFDKRRNRWYTYIRPSGKQIFGGSFGSAKEAAKAYDDLARIHFGEFAHLNFPLAPT
jgi:hypothetical protein